MITMKHIAVNLYDDGGDVTELLAKVRKFCWDFNLDVDIYLSTTTDAQYENCTVTRIIPHKPKTYIFNVDEKSGMHRMLVKNHAFWANSLKIVEHLCEGRHYDHCLTIDSTFVESQTLGKRLRQPVEANFLYSPRTLPFEYPLFFLPSPYQWLADIQTMYKLCQLWKNIEYMEWQRYAWPDFLNRINVQNMPVGDNIGYFSNFFWFSWCQNQSVKVRYLNG